MVTQWYFQTAEGQPSGPIDSRELRRLAEAGIVTPNTVVRKGDNGRWVSAESVRGLIQQSTPAPSPSLGASPPPVARLSTSQVRQEAELARQRRADRELKATGGATVQEPASVSVVEPLASTEFGRYVLATVACGAILLLYVIACGVFEWKRGGGAIPMLMLIGAMTATWKAITRNHRRRNGAVSESGSPDAPQVHHPPQPVRSAPSPSSSSMVETTLAQSTAPPSLPPAIRESDTPSRSVGGDSPIRQGRSLATANDASAKPKLVQQVTFLAIFVSSGAILLLLWALLLRGRDETQQPAELESKWIAKESIDWIEGFKSKQQVEPKPESVPEAGNVEILDLADLAELVGPSVVQINVTGPDQSITGSGFVLDKQGTIVTNFHVIKDATEGTIVFSDRTSAPIVGYLGKWPKKDIALIRVECSPDKLHPLRLTTSVPRQGERVAAFGSPLGLQQSVSEGIVSALRESEELRILGPIHVNARLIQTTTPISHGNSGGPLVNMKGMVVGVNTITFRPLGGENVNFAVAVTELPPLLLTMNETSSPLPARDMIGDAAREMLWRARELDTEVDQATEIWDAIRTQKTGDALRMLAAVPNEQRGTAYWIASGHVHFKLGNFDNAQAAFGNAVANDPNNTESLLRLALALLFDGSPAWKGHDAIARDLCKRVIQLEPTSVPAYVICGLCTQYDDWDQSIGHFKTALALDPTDFSAQYNLGVVMLSRYEKDAWEPLQEALKLEKEINLANYWVKESIPSRLSKLTALPTTNSLQLPLRLAVARAFRVGEQYERTIQEYKDVLAIEQDNPVVPWGMFFTYNAWRGSDDSDTRYWQPRGNGAFYSAGESTEDYLPVIIFNYYDMLR